MKTIAVLGAGTWGIALARILSNAGHAVTVWSALPKEIEALATNRTHPNLPGMTLPHTMTFTTQMEEALSAAEVALFAVPSVFVRSVAGQAAPFLREGMLVVDVAKGIEPDTLLPMTGVIGDELRRLRPELSLPLIALSGPTHAEEVAQDMPTSIVSAC